MFIRYFQVEAKTPRSEGPLSPATVRGYVRTLKVFYTSVTREAYLDIEIGDVNLSEGHVKIRHAKGAWERFVPIGSVVQKHLWKYINMHRQPMTDRIMRLFLGETGLPLTRSGVQ